MDGKTGKVKSRGSCIGREVLHPMNATLTATFEGSPNLIVSQHLEIIWGSSFQLAPPVRGCTESSMNSDWPGEAWL